MNRQDLIKQIEQFHPSEIQEVNPKIATYIGGMADEGRLFYDYLYNCSFAEIEDAIERIKSKREERHREQLESQQAWENLSADSPYKQGNTTDEIVSNMLAFEIDREIISDLKR